MMRANQDPSSGQHGRSWTSDFGSEWCEPNTTAIKRGEPYLHLISSLQTEAWLVAQTSYRVPNGDAYRAHARDLYEQALHLHILALFAYSDEQNAALASALQETCESGSWEAEDGVQPPRRSPADGTRDHSGTGGWLQELRKQ